MDEKEFYRCKKLGIPYLKSISICQAESREAHKYQPKSVPKQRDRPFGNHVGKEGRNPEYRKTVIQLEKERIEREKQELWSKQS